MTEAITPLPLRLHDLKRATLFFREAEKNRVSLGDEEMRSTKTRNITNEIFKTAVRNY